MFSIFKKYKWFITYYKKSYIIAIASLIAVYALSVLPPWMMGQIADHIKAKNLTFDQLVKEVMIFIGVVIAIYVLNIVNGYLLFRGSDLIARNARRSIVTELLKRSPIFYENNTTGSIMGKATNDVRAMQDLGGYGIMAFFQATIYPLAIILIMIFAVDLKLTIVSLLPIPLVMITSKIVGDKLYLVYIEIQKAFDKLNEAVLENISGVRVIRAFTNEKIESMRFKKLADDFYKNNMNQVKYNAMFPFISRVFPGFSYIIALAYGAYLIGQDQISVGNLVSFVMYLNMLVWPMFALGDFVNISEQSGASMDRVQELLDYKEIMIDNGQAVDVVMGDIDFKNFSFKYPKGDKELLKDINLNIKKGTTLGIVGKIGSGKTSLLKQLLRFYPIKENTLYISGKPVEELKIKSVRDLIGYVPQNHLLFSKTIRENIEFAKNGSEEILDKAIKASDFEKDIKIFPKGLDTMVGERGVSLSGGQKQRISIARALIKDPEILILDDSLSAVDAKTEENIIKNIKETRKGKTNIISAHRLSAVKDAEEIIVLDNGKIVERGSHDDLMKLKGWYFDQFMIQQLEVENERE